MARAIAPQEYLKRENALHALMIMLEDLGIKSASKISNTAMHSYLHRLVKFQL